MEVHLQQGFLWVDGRGRGEGWGRGGFVGTRGGFFVRQGGGSHPCGELEGMEGGVCVRKERS